jgi:hypothetical protein
MGLYVWRVLKPVQALSLAHMLMHNLSPLSHKHTTTHIRTQAREEPLKAKEIPVRQGWGEFIHSLQMSARRAGYMLVENPDFNLFVAGEYKIIYDSEHKII